MITLKNREGTRVDLDITRDDASQIAPALARGWAFVEVVEQEITHEAPDAPPAPKQRKPRAPKVEAPAETAPKEKRTRATKADESVIVSVLSMIPADGAQYKAVDIFRGKPTNGQAAAIKQLVADGRVVQHGKARGTTYSRAGAAS